MDLLRRSKRSRAGGERREAGGESRRGEWPDQKLFSLDS